MTRNLLPDSPKDKWIDAEFKILKVRITGCTPVCGWYMGEEGNVFEVLDNELDFVLLEDIKSKSFITHHIQKKDCVIV